MNHYRRAMCLSALGIVTWAVQVPALAADAPSTVSTSGAASLQKSPTLLRVSIELIASDKTTEAAVAKLAGMRNDAKSKLTSLSADAESVKVTDPSTGDGAGMTAQQRQMQMMANMRNGGKKLAAEKSVTVSATIKASFKLPAGSADEILVKSQALTDKLKAAFASAASGPATKPATSEEQELAEEMASSQGDMSGVPKPGEPHITYAFPVSDEEAKKLTADALAIAKSDAQVLAKAAGMKLGAVYQLSDGSAKAADNPYTAYMEAMGGDKTPKPEAGVREAVGTQPGDVKYSASVSATFVLQP